MPDLSTSLRTALTNLERSEPEPALTALLAAWKASKGHPKIADAIDRLSERITKTETPIAEVDGVSEQKAWNAAFKSNRPAMMGRMLDALVGHRGCNPRLGDLLKRAPDPRVTTRLRTWIQTPPYEKSARIPFFNAVAKLTAHTGDVRILPVLEYALANGGYWGFGLTSYKAFKAHAISLKRRRIPELSPDARACLEKIEATTEARKPAADGDRVALFDRVYANPNDDEARAVLSDLLQQLRDPRGEFIALQLARHGTPAPISKEERKLEQTWARPWLGALDAATEKSGVVFERGFVTHCEWKGGAVDAREWSTVTHVDVSPATLQRTSSTPMLLAPNARNIRHVRGLRVEERAELEPSKRVPWETVGWGFWSWDEAGPIEEGAGGLFAAARTLVLSAFISKGFHHTRAKDVASLLERWPLVSALEIDTTLHHLAPLLQAAPQLTRLTVRGSMDDVFTVDRVSRTLRCDFSYVRAEPAEELAQIITALRIAQVVITGPADAKFTGKNLKCDHGSMPIAPIAAAAKKLGTSLVVLGKAVTRT